MKFKELNPIKYDYVKISLIRFTPEKWVDFTIKLLNKLGASSHLKRLLLAKKNLSTKKPSFDEKRALSNLACSRSPLSREFPENIDFEGLKKIYGSLKHSGAKRALHQFISNIESISSKTQEQLDFAAFMWDDLNDFQKFRTLENVDFRESKKLLPKAFQYIYPNQSNIFKSNIYSKLCYSIDEFTKLPPKSKKFLFDRFYKEAKYMSCIGMLEHTEPEDLGPKLFQRYMRILARYRLSYHYNKSQRVALLHGWNISDLPQPLAKSEKQEQEVQSTSSGPTPKVSDLSQLGRMLVSTQSDYHEEISGLDLAQLKQHSFNPTDQILFDEETFAINDPQKKIKSILVCIGMGIGNIIQVTPVIRFLKEKFDQKIDLLVEDRYSFVGPILHDKNYVNHIFTENEYNFEPYDLIYITSTHILETPLLNSKRIIYANRHGNMFYETTQLHEAKFHFEVLKRAQVIANFEDKATSRYFVNSLEPLSKSLPKKNQEVMIGIHGGCKPGIWDKKKWPHFESLIEMLNEAGYKTISFGSKEELIKGTIDKTGTSIEETVSQMSRCQLFISNDSGLMHIADALNLPLITFFGPSSASKNKPTMTNSHIFESKLPCSPCQFSKRIQICPANVCLSSISASEVFEKVLEMLKKTNSNLKRIKD